MGTGGDQTTCQYMWSHETMWHATGPSAVTAWFDTHSRMMSLFLALYSPFLNPIEECLWAWRWNVFDHRLQDQMSLQDAMDAAYQNITAEHCRGGYQKILPKMSCQRRWMRTCGQTQKIRLHLFIVLLWLFLFVCFVLPHNNWQICCISFVFMHSCFSNVLLQIKPLLLQFCLSLFSPINRSFYKATLRWVIQILYWISAVIRQNTCMYTKPKKKTYYKTQSMSNAIYFILL